MGWGGGTVSIGEEKFLPVSGGETQSLENISDSGILVGKRIILKLILNTYWKGAVRINLIRNME